MPVLLFCAQMTIFQILIYRCIWNGMTPILSILNRSYLRTVEDACPYNWITHFPYGIKIFEQFAL